MLKNRVVILGGGICGLALAHQLNKFNIKNVIIEKNKEIGGIAGSYLINDFYIEKCYHHLFATDKTFLRLTKELEIYNNIKWYKSSNSFYHKNKFYKFSSPIDLLLFKPLKFIDRIRLGFSLLSIKKTKNWIMLDKIDAKSWLIKNLGKNAFKIIFKPLLETKFGVNINKASAAFVFGRLSARVQSRTGNNTSEKLGYYDHGFHYFIKTWFNNIKQNGSIIKTSSNIINIRRSKNKKYIVEYKENGKIKSIESKYVISTIPLELLSQICKFNLNRKVKNIKYASAICTVFGIKRKLSDFYWTNIINKNKIFGALIEHTNLVPKKYYNNNHIIYLINYLDTKHAYWKLMDKRLLEIYVSELKKMFKYFNYNDIIWYKIYKEQFATPIFSINYNDNIPPLECAKNFFVCGSFQIYPYSRNMNNIIKIGLNVAKTLQNRLK